MKTPFCRPVVGLVLAVFLAAAGCDSPFDLVTTPPPPGGVEIPIKSDLYLAVGASINGHDVNVLLDTGTVLFNVAPPSAIERFGLRASSPNPYADDGTDDVGVCRNTASNPRFGDTLYTADRVEIGGVVIENVAFVILTEDGFNSFDGIRVDCILNGALLAQFDWQVDGYGRRLSLFPEGELAAPASPSVVKAIGPNPPPLFQLLYGAVPKMGGLSTFIRFASPDREEVEALMDTGGGIEIAMGQSVFDDTGWNLDDLPSLATGLFGAGGECRTTRFRAPMIAVNQQEYENIHTIILPDSAFGLMGWRFLANHETVRVSPTRQWIEFVKGAETDGYFDVPVTTFGFDLKRQADGSLRVSRVTAGSDAEAAGVEKDQTLLEVNGVSVDTLEGVSLIFGPEIMRAGEALFLFEDSEGNMVPAQLTGTPLI